MDSMIKNERAKITWFIASILLLSAFGGCKAPAKFPAIGIVTTSYDTVVIEGFKEGMSESGYIEGENIKYITKFHLHILLWYCRCCHSHFCQFYIYHITGLLLWSPPV